MSNLAALKTQMSTGLSILPNHITDVIDAITGAKTFADVEANKPNFPLMSGDNLLGNPLAGNLAKLLNPNYGIGINLISSSQVLDLPVSFCDLSKDFTLSVDKIFNAFPTSGNMFIFPFKTNGLSFYYNSGSFFLLVGNSSGTGNQSAMFPFIGYTFEIGKKYSIVLHKSALNLKVLVNNIVVYTATLAENIGNNSNSYSDFCQNNGFISSNYISLNYAISDEELGIIYNSGRPDRAILPEYMKWGNNTELITASADREFTSDTGFWAKGGTSTIADNVFHCIGTDTAVLARDELITVGQRYRYVLTVSNYVKGALLPSSLQNSTVISANGTYIIEGFAVSSTFFFWCAGDCQMNIDNISMMKLGAVCDLEPSGIVCNSSGKVTAWTDSSTNDNDATVSGTPDLVLVKAEDYEGQGLVENIAKITPSVNQTTATPTIILDSKNVPEWISVKNNSANSLTFSLGTTASGTDIVNAQTIGAGKTKAFSVTSFEINELELITLYVTASGTALNYDTNIAQRRVKI